MHPFRYERARSTDEALAKLRGNLDASFIAGGTELLNWLKEGIVNPALVVDINRLPFAGIELSPAGVRIGALARMSEVADHPGVRKDYPAIAEALERSASMQLRNMASIGGNLMQRTRCPYFRAETELPCNKRRPGSGCAARNGFDRTMSIFGWSESCVATHPSDLAVALAALDANVRILTSSGEQSIALEDFYRMPETDAVRETVLEHGELIVGVDVPATAYAARSSYLKVRERASYEFALVSAAVALELEERRIKTARIALGGVAPKPWRLRETEAALAGAPLELRALNRALDLSLSDARPLRTNAFKIELAKRTALRAIEIAGGER
jgi:xanthine dehydrogenase YagS FAD-binding subunit